MDADLKKRKLVNYEQMQGLLDFLQEHETLAKGLTRGRRGRLHSLKLWNLCAKKLNGLNDGAIKNGRAWSKHWCDWKYRIRRKALELKVAKDKNRTPPDGILPLSEMEERIISLIGTNAIDGVVIKNDPLAEGESDEEVDNEQNNDDTASMNQYCGMQSNSNRVHKRRHSQSDLDDGTDGPSNLHNKRVSADRNDEDPNDSDHDTAAHFLRLEKQIVKNSTRMLECAQTIAAEMTRIADVLTHVRDILINNRSVL